MNLTFKKLRLWNACVGAFQTVCAIIIFAITDYDLETPWYTVFIASREAEKEGFYIPEPIRQTTVPIGVLSGIFLLLSGLDHLFTVLPGVNRNYNAGLQRNQNPYRWLEYSVSAAIMRVQIAMLSGIVDVHTLWCIFFLTATTMLFGWLMERMNGHKLTTFADDGSELKTNRASGYPDDLAHSGGAIDWTPFWCGFVPHMAAWSVIACHFFKGVSDGDPPAFVWAIIFILFTLDACFALVQFLQFKRVKCVRGFAKAEFCYIVLSLTAKQLLAWIEFGGAQSLKPE